MKAAAEAASAPSMSSKPHISVVILGESGVGKSTLAGHLAIKSGAIDARFVDKLEKETLAQGAPKERKFAWLFDRTQRERTVAGMTLCVTRFKMETATRVYTVFTVPGRKKSLRKIIPAISQADVGVLVVDANDYESGMSKDTGLTLEHALLAYTFGLRELIVAVNKMEHIRNPAARFEEIKFTMSKALRKVGYSGERMTVLPVSALAGDNLVGDAAEMPTLPWWGGASLLQQLQSLPLPVRNTTNPLRFVTREVFAPNVMAGRVEQGAVRVGQVVTLAPRMITTTVESIQMHGAAVESASAGDVVGITVHATDVAELGRADVLGDAGNPPRRVAQFVARVVVLRCPTAIKAGYTPVMACHTGSFPVCFAKLLVKTDVKTKKKNEIEPKSVSNHEQCDVLMVPCVPVCVDAIEACNSMGRFAILDSGVVAVGFIRMVTFEDAKRVRIARERMEKVRLQ